MVNYGDILVNFLRILNRKSTISQKLKIAKVGILFFHSFQIIAQHLDQKPNLTTFEGRVGVSACHLLGKTHSPTSERNGSDKMQNENFRNDHISYDLE